MRVTVHPDAAAELFEAACWYDDQVAGLGDDFVITVDRWIAVLRETPHLWPEWPGAPDLAPPIRRLLLDRFPYAIGYRVFADVVIVLAVAHASRKPFYWRSRLQN